MITSPILLMFLCLQALVDGSIGIAAVPAAVRADYEQLAKRTSADAAGQIGLALWCEKNGLEAERIKHLDRAVAIDPQNAKRMAFWGMSARTRDGSPPISLRRSRLMIASAWL